METAALQRAALTDSAGEQGPLCVCVCVCLDISKHRMHLSHGAWSKCPGLGSLGQLLPGSVPQFLHLDVVVVESLD